MVKTPKQSRNQDVCRARIVHTDRVRKAKKQAVPAGRIQGLAMVFKALGDPTRLGIVTALQGGEMCVCDLAAYLNLTESAVSHQLRRLRELSLVKNRRQGQILFYSLDDNHVAELLETALEHVMER